MENIINSHKKFVQIQCVKYFDATAKVEHSTKNVKVDQVEIHIYISNYDLIRPVG